MFDKTSFTAAELLPIYGIVGAIVAVLLYGYVRDYRIFWSPLTVVAVIFTYYCVLGPFEAISTGVTFDRLVNMRKYYPSALWGALISFLSIALGFLISGKKQNLISPPPPANDELLFIYGRRVLLIGTVLFSLSTGGNVLGLVNPFDAETIQQSSSSLSNYFFLSINFLIPGMCMLFMYWYRTRKGFWWFAIPSVLSVGVYVSIGFRYRVILLLASLAISYYLASRKRPNIIVAPLVIIVLIAVMGVINITRNYGHGLDTEKLRGRDTEAYYRSGLRESMIFQTSGAVIDNVPKKHPYVHLAPIISTALFPIPQQFYPGKNSAWYVISILKTIYGEETYKGGAYMAYAEHYLAFGWPGIFIYGLIMGWLYKKLWVWFNQNPDNPWVIVAYATNLAYIYVVLSRGYLPQVTMLFFFSVFPAFFVMWLVKRRLPKTLPLPYNRLTNDIQGRPRPK